SPRQEDRGRVINRCALKASYGRAVLVVVLGVTDPIQGFVESNVADVAQLRSFRMPEPIKTKKRGPTDELRKDRVKVAPRKGLKELVNGDLADFHFNSNGFEL